MSFTKKKQKEYLKMADNIAWKTGKDIDGDIFFIKGKVYFVHLIQNRIYFIKSLKKDEKMRKVWDVFFNEKLKGAPNYGKNENGI